MDHPVIRGLGEAANDLVTVSRLSSMYANVLLVDYAFIVV